ncbi:hypothetical protein LDENG_00052270 [Lucifuga dentata]|nr:hypothetical protein LDENG_00052270 [Lucifuga dentata]
MQNSGASRTGGQAEGGTVEAVMKMWPPPAGPKDREPEKDGVPRESSHVVPQSPSSSYEGNQPFKSGSGTPANQPAPARDPSQPAAQPKAAAVTANAPQPSDACCLTECSQHSEGRPAATTQFGTAEDGEQCPKVPKPNQSVASAHQAETDGDQPALSSHSAVPEVVVLPSMFQGTGHTAESQRPPLALDFAQLDKVQPSQATLEDMELSCQRPTTVVLTGDHSTAIGEWGEQLVNSFLCQWRDSSDPRRPEHVLWCNQSGESGQPYDFKLTFGPANSGREPWVVYVEVKATVKREKSFVQLSANELDFALKQKEHYHIFRVYSAGDSQNVRLCRIQNLAQLLHTKDLALYLFV